MIQSFNNMQPKVHETAYVHPTATLIGKVIVREHASVWPGAVLRGDNGPIVLNEGVNVQDNAVLHETVDIGRNTTVGHAAIVHDCTVGRGALIGMNSVVLNGARIGDKAIVAAGSVVTEGTEVPMRSMVAGAPATVVKTKVDSTRSEAAAAHYIEQGSRYLAEQRGQELD